jgi:ribonuclease PH
VLAVVYGPREVSRRSNRQHDRAIVNVEYSAAPFSTSERKRQRAGDRFVTVCRIDCGTLLM